MYAAGSPNLSTFKLPDWVDCRETGGEACIRRGAVHMIPLTAWGASRRMLPREFRDSHGEVAPVTVAIARPRGGRREERDFLRIPTGCQPTRGYCMARAKVKSRKTNRREEIGPPPYPRKGFMSCRLHSMSEGFRKKRTQPSRAPTQKPNRTWTWPNRKRFTYAPCLIVV